MTLEEAEALVKKAARGVWGQIAGDAGECSVDDAVELALDADRPVAFGFMTKHQYAEICKLDYRIVDKWAWQALRPLADKTGLMVG